MENVLIDRPSTAAILQRLATGEDAEAWSLLVERHGQAIYNAAYRVCGEHALAEDATQETFLHIRQDARRFRLRPGDGEASAQGWIMRIACTSTLQLLRQRGRQNRREHTFAVEQARTSDHGQGRPIGEDEDQTRLSMALRQELAELPESHRLPLLLHYYGGLDYQSIAEQMGCTAGNARVRVHRALERLRGRLLQVGALVAATDLAGHLQASEMPLSMKPALLAQCKALATSSAVPVTSTSAVLGGTSALVKAGIAAGTCLLVGGLSLPMILTHKDQTPPPPITITASAPVDPDPAPVASASQDAPSVSADATDQHFHAKGTVVRLNLKDGRMVLMEGTKVMGFSLHRHGDHPGKPDKGDKSDKSVPAAQDPQVEHLFSTLTIGSQVDVEWVAIHPPIHDGPMAGGPPSPSSPSDVSLSNTPPLPGNTPTPDGNQNVQAAGTAVKHPHHKHHDVLRQILSLTIIKLAPANQKPPPTPENMPDF